MYNLAKNKVNQALQCNECGQFIPSDEEEAINHVVEQHGVSRHQQYTHNIARLYFNDSKTYSLKDLKVLQSEVKDKDVKLEQLIKRLS